MKLTPRAARWITVTSAIACASAIAAIPAIAAAASAAPSSGKPAACKVVTHGSAVPTQFKASAMTWTSADDGWVLGATPKPMSNSNCAPSQVIATTDGGKTWHLVGIIKALIPKLGLGGTGINEIRMATDKVGWAFAPDLHYTANGGRTWLSRPIPGGAKQVLDLAVTPTGAYAIASPCGYEMGICKGALTAWRTNLAGRTWTKMAMPKPLHNNVSANVAAFGDSVYVIDPPLDGPHLPQFYASTNGGRSFSPRHNPCPALELHTLVQAVPTSATKVALFCDGNAGFGKSGKAVYLSVNTGRKDTFAGQVSPWGIQAQLAVSPTGNLAIDAWSIGSFIDINDTKTGTTWHQIIGSGDGGAGFNDITYVSGNVAWVVYGPASMFADYGQLYMTTNAGRHWSLVKI